MKEADERMDRMIAAAEAVVIEPDVIFEHVYERPTPRLERQRAELLEGLSEDD